MNIHDFQIMYQQSKKISMITCYDYWSARIIAESNIDCVLVGDSVSMVMHGHATTVAATMDMMILHTEAVVRGVGDKFVIGDMPFLSYRQELSHSMQSVQRLMQAGACAIKLEGAVGNELLIQHIVESGIPVMGHLGLTPQAIHQLGGFKVQGRDHRVARELRDQAKRLEQAGCFAIVLECVPNQLAGQITMELNIPTIGIGAGAMVAGQVLVLQDMLGLQPDFKPKFLKSYFDGFLQIKSALNQYDQEVKAGDFPTLQESYL